MRLIIGEVGTREREGLKIGRSEIQGDLGGRKGTALGTKMGRASLLTPPTPEGRDPPTQTKTQPA